MRRALVIDFKLSEDLEGEIKGITLIKNFLAILKRKGWMRALLRSTSVGNPFVGRLIKKDSRSARGDRGANPKKPRRNCARKGVQPVSKNRLAGFQQDGARQVVVAGGKKD